MLYVYKYFVDNRNSMGLSKQRPRAILVNSFWFSTVDTSLQLINIYLMF